MISGIKAVVFDLDDTLAPEYSFVKSGYRAAAEALRLKTALMKKLTEKQSETQNKTQNKTQNEIQNKTQIGIQIEEKLWELFLEDTKNVFNRLLDEYQVEYDKAFLMELIRVYREHDIYRDVYSPYGDAVSAVRALKEKGFKTGIISDGFLVSQQNKVRALGFDEKLFDRIILTAEYGTDYQKPAVKTFEMMAGSLGIKPTEMLYVGDNPKKDFYVNKTLGVYTARIYRENQVYENAEYMDGIREDMSIHSLMDLIWRME